MEGYDEERTEYSLNTKLLAGGSDFPVVPNGQARREHHKGESFLSPPHMMTAGAQALALAKGRTGSSVTPPEEAYALARESSGAFTFIMWFMFFAHAGCMVYALKVTLQCSTIDIQPGSRQRRSGPLAARRAAWVGTIYPFPPPAHALSYASAPRAECLVAPYAGRLEPH